MPHVMEVRPPKESIWRCPCGFTAPFNVVAGHRKGKKNRPECRGKIQPVSPSEPTTTSTPEPGVSGVPPAATAHRPLVYEWREGLLDPEEVARQLNIQRQGGYPGEPPPPRPPDNGEQGLGAELPPGEWALETPRQPQVSQAREVVSLPVIVRLMYDWAKQEGWRQGDGSISAFVTDVLLDHFTHCWGKAIVVINREEVRIAG